MKNLGFVGTGLIGNPMARRLLQSGFRLKAHDRNPMALETVLAAGAESAPRLEDLLDMDAVLIVVNNRDQVNEVILGEGGLVFSGREGPLPLLVVMSTLSPEDMHLLESRLTPSRAGLMDAPVSGGPFLAELGRLAVMAGGAEEDFLRLRPVFEALGEQVFHVGPLGSGMAMKLVNNMVGLASMLVVPEALALGVRCGMDVQRMVEVLNAGSGKTFITENWPLITTFLQTALEEGDPFGTRNALFITGRKDLDTAKKLARDKDFSTPVLDHLLEGLSAYDARDFLERVKTLLGQKGPA